jgi:hypothetical protein
VILFLVNVAMILVAGALLAERGRRERARIEARVAGTDIAAAAGD